MLSAEESEAISGDCRRSFVMNCVMSEENWVIRFVFEMSNVEVFE